jgi:hypothetical protein
MTAERILAAVRELLAADPSLVGAVDAHRKTPLHLAACSTTVRTRRSATPSSTRMRSDGRARAGTSPSWRS